MDSRVEPWYQLGDLNHLPKATDCVDYGAKWWWHMYMKLSGQWAGPQLAALSALLTYMDRFSINYLGLSSVAYGHSASFELPLDVLPSRKKHFLFLAQNNNVLLPRSLCAPDGCLWCWGCVHSLGTTDWVNRQISKKQYWYFHHYYTNSAINWQIMLQILREKNKSLQFKLNEKFMSYHGGYW